MDDLISREAAIDAVGYYSLHSGDKILFADKPLKELPAAQPELIRCKDCKYSEYDRLCDVMRCTYNGKAEIVHGEHYCGYADMREGQDETN